MKKWFALVLCVALIVAVAGCGGGDKKAAAPKTDAPKAKVLRVGHTLTDDSHYGVGLKKFAELVKEKSKGSLDVQVFGNSKLGNERDLIEGVSLGTVEMALSSTGPLPSFSKKFMVFDLPFIVQDRPNSIRSWTVKSARTCWTRWDPKGSRAWFSLKTASVT